MSDLILYELQDCPHCAKVGDKLSDLDLEHESRVVPSAHAECEGVEEVSGQTGVLILVDEEHGVKGMPKSDDIVDYLEKTCGLAA